jgi:hypothetical protein
VDDAPEIAVLPLPKFGNAVSFVKLTALRQIAAHLKGLQ